MSSLLCPTEQNSMIAPCVEVRRGTGCSGSEIAKEQGIPDSPCISLSPPQHVHTRLKQGASHSRTSDPCARRSQRTRPNDILSTVYRTTQSRCSELAISKTAFQDILIAESFVDYRSSAEAIVRNLTPTASYSRYDLLLASSHTISPIEDG